MTPVAGAVAQEAIDLVAVLNALRMARSAPAPDDFRRGSPDARASASRAATITGMKSRLAVLFVMLALGAPSALAQQRPPDLPFESNPEFLQLPAGMNFGEVPGVAVNSKGHVFVFTRAPSGGGSAFMPAAAQLFELGPNGAFMREIGRNLYAWAEAHSVRIDKDDNIWAIDKGSDMVVKFNPAGRVMMVFGRRKESVDEDSKPWQRDRNPPLPAIDGLFRQPTDVAWDSTGNIYITDGYINSRVAKYDKDGNWVTSWGERGTGPGQPTCRTPSRSTAATTSRGRSDEPPHSVFDAAESSSGCSR